MALQEEAKQKQAVKATEKAEKAEAKEVRLSVLVCVYVCQAILCVCTLRALILNPKPSTLRPTNACKGGPPMHAEMYCSFLGEQSADALVKKMTPGENDANSTENDANSTSN